MDTKTERGEREKKKENPVQNDPKQNRNYLKSYKQSNCFN